MGARTYSERVTQLGRIAQLELELMKRRGQRGIMPRTNKAKKILWRYYEDGKYNEIVT